MSRSAMKDPKDFQSPRMRSAATSSEAASARATWPAAGASGWSITASDMLCMEFTSRFDAVQQRQHLRQTRRIADCNEAFAGMQVERRAAPVADRPACPLDHGNGGEIIDDAIA